MPDRSCLLISNQKMRAFLLSLFCLLLPGAAWAQSGNYLVTEINPAAGTFVGKNSRATHTFRVRAGSEITLNDEQAGLANLAVGMQAKVESADPGVATKITAYGTRLGTATSAHGSGASVGSSVLPTDLPTSARDLADLLVSSTWKLPDGSGQITFAEGKLAVIDHGRVKARWWCVDGRTFHLWNDRTTGTLSPAGDSFEVRFPKGTTRTYLQAPR